MKRHSVWTGAFWLSIGSFVSKLIGAVYRIFLPRILGAYGVGIFQMAYPLYSALLVVSVNGVPTALSKEVAELDASGDRARADQLMEWTLLGLAVLGGLMALGLGFFAPLIARYVFHEPKAGPAIRALAPALAFVSLEAALRGGFQGRQEMLPTALSQIIEQVVRVAVMFSLALLWLPRGVEVAAAGATMGAPVGAAFGLGYLFWRRFRSGPWVPLRRPPPLRRLFRLAAVAAPMSLAGLLFPLMLLIDSVFVPERLRLSGMSLRQATSQFGLLSGEAMPLINLTMVVGAALAISLVPTVARLIREGEPREAAKQVDHSMHLVWLLGFPMSAGLYVLARPLTTLLYGGPGAAPALAVLALGSSVLSVQQVLGGALQAAGRGWEPVKNLGVGTVAKFALTWWLTPHLGIRGAALATVGASLTTAYLNWRGWTRIVGRSANPFAGMRWPALGAVVVAMGVIGWKNRMGTARIAEPGMAALTVLLGALMYGITMALAGEAAVLGRIWRER